MTLLNPPLDQHYVKYILYIIQYTVAEQHQKMCLPQWSQLSKTVSTKLYHRHGGGFMDKLVLARFTNCLSKSVKINISLQILKLFSIFLHKKHINLHDITMNQQFFVISPYKWTVSISRSSRYFINPSA